MTEKQQYVEALVKKYGEGSRIFAEAIADMLDKGYDACLEDYQTPLEAAWPITEEDSR